MDGLFVLLFIVFAVLSVLGRAKQMGTGAPRPGTRLPPRPGVPPRPAPGEAAPPEPERRSSFQVPDVPMPQAGSRPAAEAERAEALVPDELWAILTGERRTPVRHRPFETPHEITLPAPPEPEPGAAPTPSARVLPSGTGSVLPPVPAQAPAVVATAATPLTAVPAPRRRPRGLLADRAALRRAVLAQVVLGRPKALE